MTDGFVWYWAVLGLLLIGAATVQLIRHTASSARFDVLAALLYVVGTAVITLAVVRDAVFVIPFSIVFGMMGATVNWMSLRSRVRLRK